MLIAELDDKYPNFNFDQESQEASSFKNTQEEEKTLGNDNIQPGFGIQDIDSILKNAN